MQNTHIKVKYFDIKGNVVNNPQSAVKAEVWHFENNQLSKVEYYHIKNMSKNNKVST